MAPPSATATGSSSYTASLASPTSPTIAAYPPSHALSSSISSLSSSTRYHYPHHNRHHHPLAAPSSAQQQHAISKTYRQASTLFLTRRLPEALTTLRPLITPPPADDEEGDEDAEDGPLRPVVNGARGGSGLDTDGDDDDDADAATVVPAVREPAPVARASRNTRVKVWSLYLTILNAVLELDQDEGKEAFGAQEWRAICAKVRDGDVWEEVVRNGYHGVEGDVDSDVVINLATLLLAHAKTQHLNQRRLEAYLASSAMPNLDVAGRLREGSITPRVRSRQRSGSRGGGPGGGGGGGGTDTPRDLNARVKILELYTLHVLLRNDEWDYARDFIAATAVLDDERRDAFLQALQSLREDRQADGERRAEEERRAAEEDEREREQARRAAAAEQERRRREADGQQQQRERGTGADRDGSEVDYGVDRAPSSVAGSSSAKGAGGAKAAKAGHGRKNSTVSRSSAVGGQHHNNGSTNKPSSKTSISRAGKKAVLPPVTLASRAAAAVANLRAVLERLALGIQANPLALMRTVAFIFGILVMFGRADVRRRMSRILGASWNRLKATAAMGGKVSYI